MVLAEDGVVVDLVDGRRRSPGGSRSGRVYVDGLSVGDIGESTLGDRLVLGEGGFISITVAVDSTTGRAVSRADDRPGAGSPTTRRRWTPCCRWWRWSCRRTEAEGITDTHRIAQAVRRVVGKLGGGDLPAPPDDRAHGDPGLTRRASRRRTGDAIPGVAALLPSRPMRRPAATP